MFQSWKDKRRQIFRYWDGSTTRRADPAVIDRNMRKYPDFEKDAEVMFKDHGAYDRTVDAIKDVFGLKNDDGRIGLTEPELLALLKSFYAFVGQCRRPISFRPKIQPVTSAESAK